MGTSVIKGKKKKERKEGKTGPGCGVFLAGHLSKIKMVVPGDLKHRHKLQPGFFHSSMYYVLWSKFTVV